MLELYVLRNNQTGRSRGCAFVTYASRQLAEQVPRHQLRQNVLFRKDNEAPLLSPGGPPMFATTQ